MHLSAVVFTGVNPWYTFYMVGIRTSFSGFSVDNIEKAEAFYSTILGLVVENNGMGLKMQLPGGGMVFVYQKENHHPATFTILNFVVADIDVAVDELLHKGITFEHYTDMSQDEKGIARGISQKQGPDIAWFKDPAGNILSVLQEA